MSRDTKQQAVHLPLDLHAQIVNAAVKNNRSAHSEMLQRLADSFDPPADAAAKAQLDRLEAKLDAMNPERLVIAQSLPDADYEALFAAAMGKGRPSPTGRLSESQPELQDLPPVSGLSTLAASMRKNGCMCGGGMAVLSPGEHRREFPWIENAGYRPDHLRPNQLIQTKTRPHGATAKRMVGDIPASWWGSSPSRLPRISHWRLAE